MGDAGGPTESSGGDGSGKDLPVMPGPEKPLLHIAIEFVEMLDNALAEHQMLNVAVWLMMSPLYGQADAVLCRRHLEQGRKIIFWEPIVSSRRTEMCSLFVLQPILIPCWSDTRLI